MIQPIRSRLFSWRQWSTAAALLVATVGLASSAAAQVVPLGPSVQAIKGLVRGSDVAYDPANGVFLSVGAYGAVRGAFTNASGSAVTPAFVIFPGDVGFAHYPRVAYSPHLNNGQGGTGAFLVLWHHDAPDPNVQGGVSNFVHGRVVAFVGGQAVVVGNTFVVSDGNTFWEAAPALAYSPLYRRFLVTWQTCCGGFSVVKGRGIAVNGSGVPELVGAPGQISVGYGRDPGVAYHPGTQQFAVSFSGDDGVSPTTVLALISSTDGVLVRRNVFARGSANYITDIALNSSTGRFVVSWSQSGVTWTGELDSAGDLLGIGPLSTFLGTYDSGSLAYNPQSGTFLFVGHHPSGEVGAAELTSRGALVGAISAVSATGGVGAFYPRAGSSAGLARWSASFSRAFGDTMTQALLTSTGGGGGGAPLPVPGGGGGGGGGEQPPPPPPPPGGCTTIQPGPGWTCANGGWLPPGSGGGEQPPPPPPPGCTTPQPGAGWTCVNGGWQPPGQGGGGLPTCSTPAPVPGWVQVNGGWVPPDHPLAAQATCRG